MFDHVTTRVSNPLASQRFYDTVLAAIGLERDHGDFGEGCPEFAQWGDFSIAEAPPVTTGLHIAFAAKSRDEVDAFWRAGVDAGYESDGEPGEREYTNDYYGGFLLDPDGNSVEAVHFATAVEPGRIDHLWIRVADLDANRRFYEAIAPYSGFEARPPQPHPERVHFRKGNAGFALVDDGRALTNGLHLAFSADSDELVDQFHAAAVAAGYPSNGAPGERSHYHPGYYGAFVLDPAGANVELVNHNR